MPPNILQDVNNQLVVQYTDELLAVIGHWLVVQYTVEIPVVH